MVGSSFSFFSVLLPPPIWENEITVYNIVRIEMENCHFFCKTNAVIYAIQIIHLILLSNPLTATKRVGIE